MKIINNKKGLNREKVILRNVKQYFHVKSQNSFIFIRMRSAHIPMSTGPGKFHYQIQYKFN